MTGLTRTTAALAIVVGMGLCFAAADEQAPQTGTIEVEVIYKDTGEPVEGTMFFNVSGAGAFDSGMVEDGHGSVSVAPRIEPYDVELGGGTSSSLFIALPESEAQRTVTVSASHPTAHIRYEVERGWRLSGTLKRPNGVGLYGVLVVVKQGDGSLEQSACSTVDMHSNFDMLGVLPSDTALVSIYSLVMVPGTRAWGYLCIHEEPIALTGEASSADLVLDIARVTLEIRVAHPVWPFRAARRSRGHRLFVQIGGESSVEDASGRSIELDLSGVPIAVSGGQQMASMPQDEYKACFLALPADERVTFRIDTLEYEWLRSSTSHGGGAVEVTVVGEVDPHSERVVAQTRLSIGPSGNQELRVVHYEPNARLSRLFWFGVPSVLVLAVFGTILVRQIRKRRGRAAAREE